MGIIYEVTNLIDGKKYVGQSVETINRRRAHHYSHSKTKEKGYFHRALNKYPMDSFKWEILTEISDNKLDKMEKLLIFHEKSMWFQNGYNLQEGGAAPRHAPETIKKISKSSREYWGKRGKPTKNFKNKISKKNRGRSWHGFEGAYYKHKGLNPWRKVWVSGIKYNHNRRTLGHFNDPLSAELVYQIVVGEIYGN